MFYESFPALMMTLHCTVPQRMAPRLRAWAVEHPLFCISLSYGNGDSWWRWLSTKNAFLFNSYSSAALLTILTARWVYWTRLQGDLLLPE